MHHRIAPAAVAALAFLALGCADAAPTDPAVFDGQPELARANAVHHVTAGSPDACGAWGWDNGCNGNWSLNAFQYADGSASGTLVDTFGHGDGGLRVAIDCVDVRGNVAFVSGIVEHGWGEGEANEGTPAVAMVTDNGTSANDTPDTISYTYTPALTDCRTADPQYFAQFPLEHGQVKVR